MTDLNPRIPRRERIDWSLMAGIAVSLALLACACWLLVTDTRG